MITFDQLRKQFTIANMIPVTIPKGSSGYSTKLKINGAAVDATYLADLKEGSAIALLTDKGNWYLLGVAVTTPKQSNKRIIEYRKTSTNEKKEFLKDFIVLAQTKRDTNGNINLNNSSSVHFAGIENQTISIDWLSPRAGTTFTVTYPGGSATTNPTPIESVGQSQIFAFEYAPSPNTDGFLTISTTGAIGYQYFSNVFYYVTNGKEIQKLSFNQSEQIADFYNTNRVYSSISNNKIYVSFMSGFIPLSAPIYEKVRLITIDLLTLAEESNQEFIYIGDNQIDIDNTDWRQSVTHSFLINPPSDGVACINTYRKNNFAHIDTVKNKIILSGNFIFELGKKEASVSKFNPSASSCSTNFKKVLLKSKVNSDLQFPLSFCNITGISIYQ